MVDQHVEVPTSTQQPTILGSTRALPASPPANEGRTVAAWTMVAIVLFGAVLVGVGIPTGLTWLAWVGVGVVVAGLVVGGVLRALGYGQATGGRSAAGH